MFIDIPEQSAMEFWNINTHLTIEFLNCKTYLQIHEGALTEPQTF